MHAACLQTHHPPRKNQEERWSNVSLMVDHRRRCWANIKTTLGQCRLFTGLFQTMTQRSHVSNVR